MQRDHGGGPYPTCPHGEEVITYATDPLLADTDGGGVADGDEVSAGSDPIDAADDVVPGPTGDTGPETGGYNGPETGGHTGQETGGTGGGATATHTGTGTTPTGPTDGAEPPKDETGCGCGTSGARVGWPAIASLLALATRRRTRPSN